MKDYIQEHFKGIVGTIMVHIAMIIILLSITMVQFEPVFPDEPGGVEVNFGTDETGFGDVEPGPNEAADNEQPVEELVPEAISVPEEQIVEDNLPVKNSSPQQDVKDEIVTQSFDEEAAAVAEQKKIEQQRIDHEKKEMEAQRARQLEEAQKIAAENQRKSQEKQTLAKGLFGKGSGTGSEGVAGGSGNQGQLNGVAGADNYTGDPGSGGGSGGGAGKGVGYSIANRSAVDLPRPPKGIQAEGKVVVEILVDRNGNVVDARPGVKGTNTTNERLYQASKDAAMKAKFNVSANAPERQKGTLTYIFELQ